jgi:hypothetical protein
MIELETKPSILVSYAYRKAWETSRHLGLWREVVIDSGAFTAHSTGIVIELAAFADWVLEQKHNDPLVTEVFTLDVIGGSWRDTERNTRELWKRGVEAMPVFHVGEPTDVLRGYARDYPKVALGGAVGYHKKMEWAALCFREVWPKRLHGLGFGPRSLDSLPFHTIDHSTWTAAHMRGTHDSHGGARLGRPTRGTYALPAEVAHQLALERRARLRWSGKLPSDWSEPAPSVRLVAASATTVGFAALGPVGSDLPGRKGIRPTAKQNT